MSKLSSSAKEVRLAYECNNSIWREWIEPLYKNKTIKKGAKKYNPKQIKAIIELLGKPD